MNSPAPDIVVTDLSGNPWRLSEALHQGPVLLAFFKISCPTCAFTLPYLQRLAERAAPGAPAILAISQDDPVTTGKFLQHFNIRLSAAIDKAWAFEASSAFGLTGVPSLFLVEQDRTISHSGLGFAKSDLEILGKRFGASPFDPGEQVPEFRPG